MGISASDGLMSYPRHLLDVFNSSVEMHLEYSTAQADWTSERVSEVRYILTFDPAQKYYSKVIHRKEVTHSNGQ